jgi:hypothetical protein
VAAWFDHGLGSVGGGLVRSVGTHRSMGGGLVWWVAVVKNSV